MTASSRQKKKKQLIVKLRIRQQKQKQKQKQKQRNNVISTTGQSGRGMRIRRAPKRSYQLRSSSFEAIKNEMYFQPYRAVRLLGLAECQVDPSKFKVSLKPSLKLPSQVYGHLTCQGTREPREMTNQANRDLEINIYLRFPSAGQRSCADYSSSRELNSSVREQSAVFFTPLQRFIMTALELIACE